MPDAIAGAFTTTNQGTKRRGLVIKRWPGSISIENPGGFRIPLADAIRGSNSDPRNEIIKILNLIGVGERAGSGIPNIYHVWDEQKWDPPLYREEFDPNRAILTLPINKVCFVK